jgi:ABC-type branched-subunit amino acid transport system ATPase component/branched-subunit amino acid ABC-type transport system permease component
MILGLAVTSQIVFNGLVQGAIYGVLALALVLVYRTSRVINFAVGNMGLVGAGLLVILDVNYGMPYWLALGMALVVGAAYGAVIEMIVIRRLFRAPRVIVLVATIGVAQLSLAILNTYPNLVGEGLPFPRAVGGTWTVGGVEVSGPQVTVLVVAPLLAVALAWALNRTAFGRVARAASANRDLARLAGVNPKVVSTCVWGVTGFVATVSMVLLGGLNAAGGSLATLGPTTLLRALVAALIGRFRSFPTALAAGLGIGLAESALRFNTLDQPGVADVVLLLVVLLVVAIQGRERTEGEAFSFTPKTDPIPERLRQIFWVRNLDRLVLLAPLAVAIGIPVIVTQPSRHLLYATVLAFAICALSLTVLTGWGGQLSLGQMAFAGIGALVAAALTRGLTVHWTIAGVELLDFELYGIPFVVSLLLAATFTALLAAALGAGALRVPGLLLAVTTFAFAIAASSWLYSLDVLSGGNSTSAPFPRGEVLGLDLRPLRTYYYAVLGVLVLVVALLGRIRRTGVGRVTLAVRDNPISAASYTIRPSTAKLRAFALSGWIAGIGGGLLGAVTQQVTLADPSFLVDSSVALVAMVVIGGMGSTVGAVLGALWVIGLPALAPGNAVVPLLSSSLGLLVLLLYFPGGFVEVAHRARSALYRHLERRLQPADTTTTVTPPAIGRTARATVAHDVVLRTSGVSVSFGGLRANREVSIEVRSGEIVGLIGTNGAGKTTLMNAIGGFVPATGCVELLGEDVSSVKPAGRARIGLGRTFQEATLFPELTVRESVEVALEARGRSSLVATMFFTPRARARERAKRRDAAELIDFLGLGRYAERPIVELSTGTRRIVELAGLLALDARLLCLDEPTAGIAQRESEAMAPLLVQVRRELDAAMLIIEHDMPLIMGMSDRIYCLEAGRVIASGDSRTVRDDPAVIASYLGTDERTIQRSGAMATTGPPKHPTRQPKTGSHQW